MTRHATIIPSLIFTCLLFTACSQCQHGNLDQRNLGMQGAADTLVVPDRAIWTVRMNDMDADLQAAKAGGDAKLAGVLAALGNTTLVEGSISVGAARIERQFRRCDDGVNRFSHFVVRRVVSFQQDDLGAVEGALDRLVASGEVEASFVYEVSDPEGILKALRMRAMDQARAKAASLAGHAGFALGEIQGFNVQENNHMRHMNRHQEELVGVAGPEAQRLETRVHVNFRMMRL